MRLVFVSYVCRSGLACEHKARSTTMLGEDIFAVFASQSAQVQSYGRGRTRERKADCSIRHARRLTLVVVFSIVCLHTRNKTSPRIARKMKDAFRTEIKIGRTSC